MDGNNMPHRRIVSRDEWMAARKALLAKEKELTRRRDALSADRRDLPMVKVDKTYAFDRRGQAWLRHHDKYGQGNSDACCHS